MMDLKQFGVVGLGVMGRNLALNFLDKGFSLSVFNRQIPNKEVDIAQLFAAENAYSTGFDDFSAFVASLEKPRKILIMVNAGKPVDDVIEHLVPYLEEGDILMDGGNSHFLDTQKRFASLKEKGIQYLGVGVSGGEEGARKGPSIMPGGSQEGYKIVAPFFEAVSAKDKQNKPCCAYSGPDGAGHFVKMVHNGIEYAEMQILAELYYVMRTLSKDTPEEIASTLGRWQKEGEGSFLLEITQQILRKKEGDGLLLDKIVDAAEQKGTGGWSLKAALDLGVPLDTISAAVSARMTSSKKKKRVETSAKYEGLTEEIKVGKATEEELKNAYIAARTINHVIGFAMLYEASQQFGWNLNLSEIARIWTNGCIIRSELIEKLGIYLKEEPQLLLHSEIEKRLKKSWVGLSQIVSKGLQKGLALPVLSASANYFLGAVTANSPANLIQAQRDFFGAHTYQRVGEPENQYFHTHWTN